MGGTLAPWPRAAESASVKRDVVAGRARTIAKREHKNTRKEKKKVRGKDGGEEEEGVCRPHDRRPTSYNTVQTCTAPATRHRRAVILGRRPGLGGASQNPINGALPAWNGVRASPAGSSAISKLTARCPDAHSPRETASAHELRGDGAHRPPMRRCSPRAGGGRGRGGRRRGEGAAGGELASMLRQRGCGQQYDRPLILALH